MPNKLKLITAKAKKLYATGKYKKWTDAIKQASKSLGAVKIIQKGETKKTKTSKTLMQKRDKKGHFKGYSVVSGVTKTAKKKVAKKSAKSYHKDTKSHNVRISVMSGRKSRINGIPDYTDKDMARELYLWATNDSQLYYQQRRPILINLSKKYKKGTFDIDKASKLWRYFIDNALQKYNKEFGSRGDKWYELMSVHDRNLLAHELAEETKQEFDLGNFTEK
jgi:hypothetical protein